MTPAERGIARLHIADNGHYSSCKSPVDVIYHVHGTCLDCTGTMWLETIVDDIEVIGSYTFSLKRELWAEADEQLKYLEIEWIEEDDE